MTDRAVCSQPKNKTADVQHASTKCESLGLGKQKILRGNPSAIGKEFFAAHGRPSTSFLTEYAMLLQGPLGGHFDIFAASDESTVRVLL